MPRGSPRLRSAEGKINQVGERVKQRRHELSLSQDALCARLADGTAGGWAPAWQDVSRIENGSRTVTDMEILALGKALGCGACWLLTGVN